MLPLTPRAQALSLALHSASGTLALGLEDGAVELWALNGGVAAEKQGGCLRELRATTETELHNAETQLGRLSDALREPMSREQELTSSIAALEANRTNHMSFIVFFNVFILRAVEREKAELVALQTASFLASKSELSVLTDRRDVLLSRLIECDRTLARLSESVSQHGMDGLRGDLFAEWLCDIGLRKLQADLRDIDGESLAMLDIASTLDMGLSFNDAAHLQLRGFVAHCGLGEAPTYEPPLGSMLAWTEEQTASWLASLGEPFSSLSSAGWHGAALCSLTPSRVAEASKGTIRTAGAVQFINLVREKRREVDGTRSAWVAERSGATCARQQTHLVDK